MNFSKISLGTAQLGLNYGIANLNGKPDFKSSFKMLKFAWKKGINTFDTSPLYGNSEEIIGSFYSSEIKDTNKDFNVISKLPKFGVFKDPSFNRIYDIIKNQLLLSLERLGINKLPFYLIHHPQDLNLYNGLIVECLDELKKNGFIENIGISVYNPEEAEAAIKFKKFNAIQLPINLFDHRFYKKNILKKLKKHNFLIFARSIYLQGLFFLPPDKLPKNLAIAKQYLIKLNKLIKECNLNTASIAFLFVRDIPEIDSMVIGAENIDQIAKNMNFLKEKPLAKELFDRIIDLFSYLPEKLINPSLWNKSSETK